MGGMGVGGNRWLMEKERNCRSGVWGFFFHTCTNSHARTHTQPKSASVLWLYIYGSLGAHIKRIMGLIPTWKLHTRTHTHRMRPGINVWIWLWNESIGDKNEQKGKSSVKRGIKEKCSWVRGCRQWNTLSQVVSKPFPSQITSKYRFLQTI